MAHTCSASVELHEERKLAVWRSSVFWAILSVGCGSLFLLQLGGGATLRLFDAVWLVAALIIVTRLSLGGLVHVLRAPLQITLSYWLYFGLLIGLPLFGVLANQLPISNVIASPRTMIMATFIYVVYAVSPSRRGIASGCERALAVSVIANLLYAVLQQLEFLGVIAYGSLPHHQLRAYLPNPKFHLWWRSVGLFSSPAFVGWLGMLSGLVFLSLYVVRRRFRYACLAVCSMMLPLLANSRTALVCTVLATLAVGGVVFLGKQAKMFGRWVRYAAVVGILGSIALGSSFLFEHTMGGLRIFVEGARADLSFLLRTEVIWRRGIDLFLRYPWGYGGDTGLAVGPIDSAWLQALAQGGVVLVFALFLFLCTSMFYGARVFLRTGSPYGLALMGAAVATAIGSTTSSVLGTPVGLVVFLAILLLTVLDDRGLRCPEMDQL